MKFVVAYNQLTIGYENVQWRLRKCSRKFLQIVHTRSKTLRKYVS